MGPYVPLTQTQTKCSIPQNVQRLCHAQAWHLCPQQSKWLHMHNMAATSMQLQTIFAAAFHNALHTCTYGQRSVPGRHKLCLGRCMAGRLCSAAVDTLGRWRLRRQVSCICSAGSPSFTPSGHGTSLWLMKLGYLTTPACPAQSKSMNRTSTPPPSTILHVYRRQLAGKHSQTSDATAQEHAAENVSCTLTIIVSSTHCWRS